LGNAVLAAKRAYVHAHGFDADVILGWTILGDPALQIGN
jgi:hypothetical protein